MKDDSKLQSMLSKINQFLQGKDEEADCKIASEAQRIYGLIREAYQNMKNQNSGIDFYDYNPDLDEGIYIRNTVRPSFGVTLRCGFSDLQGFQDFCEEHICKPCLDKDPNVSNLEFFIGVPDENCPNGRKKMRYNYVLADELKFIEHGIEGCTHSFCKIVMKEKKL